MDEYPALGDLLPGLSHKCFDSSLLVGPAMPYCWYMVEIWRVEDVMSKFCHVSISSSFANLPICGGRDPKLTLFLPTGIR